LAGASTGSAVEVAAAQCDKLWHLYIRSGHEAEIIAMVDRDESNGRAARTRVKRLRPEGKPAPTLGFLTFVLYIIYIMRITDCASQVGRKH